MNSLNFGFCFVTMFDWYDCADDHTDSVPVIKTQSENPTKLVVAKKSRLGRKSLGEYFTHSPLPFRRSSLFAKTSSSAPVPPLKTRRTLAFVNGVTSSVLSSPEEELPSPIREEPESFESNESHTTTGPKFLTGYNGRERILSFDDGLKSGYFFTCFHVDASIISGVQ